MPTEMGGKNKQKKSKRRRGEKNDVSAEIRPVLHTLHSLPVGRDTGLSDTGGHTNRFSLRSIMTPGLNTTSGGEFSSGNNHNADGLSKSLKLQLLQSTEDTWERHQRELRETTAAQTEEPQTEDGQNDQLSYDFVINGMKQFNFNGIRISRAIVLFNKPPEPHPLTLCFQIPHYLHLTHLYVLEMVKRQISESGLRIQKRQVTEYGTVELTPVIQHVRYVDRNVIHATRKIDNRWIVKLSDSETFHKLLRTGVYLNSMKVAVRSFESVLHDEYIEYQKYDSIQQAMLLKLAQINDLKKGVWPTKIEKGKEKQREAKQDNELCLPDDDELCQPKGDELSKPGNEDNDIS